MLNKIKIADASLFDLFRTPYIINSYTVKIIELRTRQKKKIIED